jgi:hypothetical protein
MARLHVTLMGAMGLSPANVVLMPAEGHVEASAEEDYT